MRKLFGTDGIRGKANIPPMTPEVALKVGKAVAQVFMKKEPGEQHRIIIGKDTRLSGYMFENALSSGLLSMGADVIFVGPMPTPAIAHLSRSMQCAAGIMLSASHNPAEDNGIKIFSEKGLKLSDEVEQEIEEIMANDKTGNQAVTGEKIGKAIRVEDAKGRYIEFLKNTINNNSLEGLKIVLDCANGSSYKIAPPVFSELGADVVPLHCSPNGMNINENCGATHPEVISESVEIHGGDIGFSFDGDGDRVILADERGNLVEGSKVIAIAALDLKEKGKLKNNTVVINKMANTAFLKFMDKQGIQVVQTPVGDRYVTEGITQAGASLGGEPNGHILFSKYSTTDDGIIAALQIANILKQSDKRMSEISKLYNLYPEILLNIKVKKRKQFSKMKKVTERIESAKKEINGDGKVFVRYSGTEKIARVLVEGKNEKRIKQLAGTIAREIKKEVGE